jgi:hypothetical protein
VAAINAHNIREARALLTPAHARQVEAEADSWFRNVRSITNLHMNPPAVDRFDARRLHYRFAVVVGTRFILKQRKVESMPNGPTTWSFFLVRNRRGQAWRIGDEGTG